MVKTVERAEPIGCVCTIGDTSSKECVTVETATPGTCPQHVAGGWGQKEGRGSEELGGNTPGETLMVHHVNIC